nr:PREDICTED: protein msta-like isoform X1 [Bemisia tabaci]
MKRECQVCSAPASFTCQNCAQTHYCDRDHQREDWPKHKLHCAPILVAHNETLGRHLIAARPLRQGELLLRERPLVAGPRVGSTPVCVSCYRTLPGPRPRLCGRCGGAWVCGAPCEGGAHAAECAALRGRNVAVNAQWVLPLRCYLGVKGLKTDPEPDTRWQDVLGLETHEKERRGSVRWSVIQRFVVQELQEAGVISNDAELMHKLCSIIDVNSFEIRGPENASGRAERFKGIYLKASLMSHSCVPNTHLAVSNDFQLILRAAVPVEKGEIISFNYTGPIKSTTERQDMLSEEKYFLCRCERCLDPTELGTHMNSLNCPACHKDGILTKRETEWTCSNCSKTLKDDVVRTTIFEARRVLDTLDLQNQRALETVLARFSRTFHPNHAIMIDLKQMLIERYRSNLLVEVKPCKKLLRKKIELCRQILPVIRLIEPGISRLRGLTLYAFHLSIVLLGNREFEAREITRKELISKLEEAEAFLKEAVFHLSYEPKYSPEGILFQQAETALKCLQETITEYQEDERAQEHRNKGIRRGKRR